MTPADALLYAGIGTVSGFFAGLLGTGGGVIITPALIILLADNFPPSAVTAAAVASSMAAIVMTSVPSAITHARNKAVNWRDGLLLSAGAMPGALVAAQLAALAPPNIVNVLLAAFLARMALSMFRPRPAAPSGVIARRFAKPNSLPFAGAFFGGAAALFGVGGGAMTTPFLAARGERFKTAVGTSALFTFPVSVAAAASYVIAGWGGKSFPEHTLGYVYLPAVLVIGVLSMLSAVAGATLTARLPDKILRHIFGLMLVAFCVRLLMRVAGI